MLDHVVLGHVMLDHVVLGYRYFKHLLRLWIIQEIDIVLASVVQYLRKMLAAHISVKFMCTEECPYKIQLENQSKNRGETIADSMFLPLTLEPHYKDPSGMGSRTLANFDE